MRHLNYPQPTRTSDPFSVQIEPAYDCDGSLCHQPIFTEEGELNHVPPHCHVVEWNSNGVHYHAVFCEFPVEREPMTENGELFANYPPYRE